MSEKQITRKSFIKGVGVTVAGVAVTGGLSGLLTGCASPAVSADTSAAPAWPFKYKKLDPEVVQARAFNGYKEKGGWGVGVAEGFFGTLADEVGYPFNQLPPEAFISAASGYGQASLCGCIGVAAACIGTVCDADTSKKILADLSKWYKSAEFPIYQPEGLNLPTTVAESTLCEQSVGNFMEVAGVAYGDPERKSRCAGTTADVTRKMVEMLNEVLAWWWVSLVHQN